MKPTDEQFEKAAQIISVTKADMIAAFDATRWKPIESAPTDGRRLWISDGKEVWHIMAHKDGSHKKAPLCRFWMTAKWPDPPNADQNRG